MKTADETINIPLYYAIIEDKKVYDEESIREHFETRLRDKGIID